MICVRLQNSDFVAAELRSGWEPWPIFICYSILPVILYRLKYSVLTKLVTRVHHKTSKVFQTSPLQKYFTGKLFVKKKKNKIHRNSSSDLVLLGVFCFKNFCYFPSQNILRRNQKNVIRTVCIECRCESSLF